MTDSTGELLTMLRVEIPRQFMRIRREIRRQDLRKLELGFLKMNKLLLQIGFKQELLPSLPRSSTSLSKEEWNDVREEVRLLELVLERLARSLPASVNGELP